MTSVRLGGLVLPKTFPGRFWESGFVIGKKTPFPFFGARAFLDSVHNRVESRGRQPDSHRAAFTTSRPSTSARRPSRTVFRR
jgi:hypothetical protein